MAARLIDTGVLAATAASVFGVGLLLRAVVARIEDSSAGSGEFLSSDELVLGLFLVYAFVPSLPTALYVYEVFLAKRNGQTLGKRLMGLQILRRHDGTTVSLPTGGRLVARTAVMYVPLAAALTAAVVGSANQHSYRSTILLVIPAYAFVLALPVLFTKQRRGVHDWVAGTVVVSAPAGWERPARRGPGDEGFDRWQGFMRGGGSASTSGMSFHPNAAGHDGYARLLEQYIRDQYGAGVELTDAGLPVNPEPQT